MFLRGLFLSALLLLVFGCFSLSDHELPVPLVDCYEPIDDPLSIQFIDQVLKMARMEFGAPAWEVREVRLLRSRKKAAWKQLRIKEDFSLTEVVDTTNRVVAVYISEDPGNPQYFPLLAHECVHVLNPLVRDWYMEGMASVFALKVCRDLGRPDAGWAARFEHDRLEPYACSFRMMSALQEHFPDEYSMMIQHAVADTERPGWQRIDIDGWIALLPPERRTEAYEVITPFAKILKRHVSDEIAFTAPLRVP